MLYKRNRRHFLQLICVLMLLLVHLDTYGYDFICSLQNDTTRPPVSTSSAISFSSAETQIEWSNPDYRAHSSRQTYSDYMVLHPDFSFWLLKPCTRNTCPRPIPPSVIHKGIAVYLSHCLLII